MNNRIKELREKNNLTLRGLGDKVNMSSSRISQYETGKREPKLETWKKLADFFNVSVPYLQGIEDKRNNGYSKDYIYKLLDTMFKEDWMDKTPLSLGLATKMLEEKISSNLMANFFAKSTIEIYCENHNIKIPSNVRSNYGVYDLDFWKENFDFIFDDTLVKRLLTTRDSYTDDEIKRLILSAIAVKNTRYTLEQTLNKLNSNQ